MLKILKQEYFPEYKEMDLTEEYVVYDKTVEDFLQFSMRDDLDNIKEIHESAFENSQEFTFAQMTTSIEKIENNAFKNCPNLKYIVYSGTIEQWDAIEKGTDWDAGTGNYTVYCSDGEITKN